MKKVDDTTVGRYVDMEIDEYNRAIGELTLDECKQFKGKLDVLYDSVMTVFNTLVEGAKKAKDEDKKAYTDMVTAVNVKMFAIEQKAEYLVDRIKDLEN